MNKQDRAQASVTGTVCSKNMSNDDYVTAKVTAAYLAYLYHGYGFHAAPTVRRSIGYILEPVNVNDLGWAELLDDEDASAVKTLVHAIVEAQAIDEQDTVSNEILNRVWQQLGLD